MPHFLVIFTIRKMTKATIMKVIMATKKFPIPNNCPVQFGSIGFPSASKAVGGTAILNVDRFPRPGIAKPISGISRSLTSDWIT